MTYDMCMPDGRVCNCMWLQQHLRSGDRSGLSVGLDADHRLCETVSAMSQEETVVGLLPVVNAFNNHDRGDVPDPVAQPFVCCRIGRTSAPSFL